MKILAENKKAYYNYQILEKFEAGVNLAGNYIILKGKEVFWVGANIPPYQPKNAPADYDPARARKLLLKKSEIRRLIGKVKEKGLTLVPLRVYTKNAKIKLEFGIAKGKQKTDKRELIKKRETDREIRRALKGKIQ